MEHPVDLDELAREIDQELSPNAKVGKVVDYAPRRERLPPYIVDDPDTTEIGKLAGEAIVKEYEGAAKSLEHMSGELRSMINQLIEQVEHLCSEATGTVRDIELTCAAYRNEAKAMFERIQSAAKVTEHIRTTAVELRGKIVDTPNSPLPTNEMKNADNNH